MSVVATTAASMTSVVTTPPSFVTTGTIASALSSAVATAIPSIVASILPATVTTTQPATTTIIQLPASWEIISAFAGALAGALAAVRLRFDLIGIMTLAVVSGLGGGIIRDVLLQKYGVYALQNPRMLMAALAAALFGFFFFSVAERLKGALFLVDALALGLFAAIGTDKAVLAGLTVVPAVLLGTITAVGGGVLRDILTGTVPQVLRPGAFYATAAVAGSIFYITIVEWLNIVKVVALAATVALVIGLRLITRLLGWQTPTASDLTPLVVAAPRRMIRTGGRAIEWVRPSSWPTGGARGRSGERDPGEDGPTEDEDATRD